MEKPPVIMEQTPPSVIDSGRASAVRAAKLSLWAPVITIPVNILIVTIFTGAQFHGLIATVLQTFVITLVLVAGIWWGISSIRATSRYGRSGIYGRALAGVIINSLLLIGCCYALFRGFQLLSRH